MGEGLKADEARDAAFLLTGAGMWVGKSAYLTTDPMMLQEGKRAIARAVSDHGVKVRGLGRPRVNLPAQQPLGLTLQGLLHLETSLHMRSPMTDGPLDDHPVAEGITGEGETRGRDCLGFHPLC